MTACGMSTHSVQSTYKKCLELHVFVPFFFKKKIGGPLGPPFT